MLNFKIRLLKLGFGKYLGIQAFPILSGTPKSDKFLSKHLGSSIFYAHKMFFDFIYVQSRKMKISVYLFSGLFSNCFGEREIKRGNDLVWLLTFCFHLSFIFCATLKLVFIGKLN